MTKYFAIFRKILIALVGGILLAVGIAMIVLPGPAIIVIPMALAILALEFACARRWQTQFRERIKSIVGKKTN